MTELTVLGDRPRGAVIAVRVLMLALVATLLLIDGMHTAELLWLALLLVAVAIATVAPPTHRVAQLGRAAEVLVVTLAASTADDNFLVFLPVPVIGAVLAGGRRVAGLLLGLAAVVLAAGGASEGLLSDRGYLGTCLQWLVLAGAGAYQAAILQRALLARRTDETPQPYVEATRLLTQLRSVARQLPGATLDPGGLAEHLLDEVRAMVPSSRGAVLSGSGGGRLVVLAQAGVERLDWETALDTESSVADAWATQQPVVSGRSQARSVAPSRDISSMVVPLVAGVRTVGLIVLESDSAGAYPPPVLARVTGLTGAAALRLEAALLFDEVRSLATTEERQRLAREIHDGVAQELVMVGYGIDNAVAALPDATAAEEELRILRAEVTRVITELRLSLFELRSEVDRYGGLTAAIADYARTVGASAGLRVHLSLDETTARLPAAVEAELLRIAQEAITNARKHAGAENLWVTCAVDPPFAQVEISDDGSGIGKNRPDGRYGLAIMAERAERIRGRLEITPRVPNGTTVAVVLGTAPRAR
ncbi:GAF domain-containing sensor histidine kinase [Dactylosporangium sp. NBC_01737]|uniref:sensor histidine kinase n=1 Tax=Dactylosporangium sp. NBC_01737 TaxID=2975959 RepID=UPI003FA34F39|nr:GAF domain-containing sensor histidine kinase [Dactylosporangium sp. NBC_01737]